MSSKPKGNETKELHAITSHVAETGEASAEKRVHDEDIRRRAYEIYLDRGEEPGLELDDWLQAERELAGEVLLLAQAS